MKNRLALLLLLTTMSIGCLSHDQAKLLFIQERDFDRGRLIRQVPLPQPIKIEVVDEKTSLYIYEFKRTGCQWSYTVDNESKRILSWQYISDPDLCYMKVSYGGS